MPDKCKDSGSNLLRLIQTSAFMYKLNEKTKILKSDPKNLSFYYLKTKHPFHLVDSSPWPLFASLGAFMLTTGGVLYMHRYKNGFALFLTGVFLVLYVMFTWWRDIVREATFESQHSFAVQRGLRLGMILFIVSEIMFFFAFFWAFFHSSIVPVFNIGGVWPPILLNPVETFGIPFTNTCLSSNFGGYSYLGSSFYCGKRKKRGR